MNIKLVKLLSALCACLLVLVIAEWIVAKYARDRLLESIESSNAMAASEVEMPSIDLKKKSEESYVDLVARPLFIKGRKPVDEPTPDHEKTAVSADNLDWQLNGIYTGKNGFSALFSRAKTQTDKDNFRKLSQNDDLDGWKLTQIQKDRVILTLGDETKELQLRKPKPKELPKNQMPSKTGAPSIPKMPDRRRPGLAGIPTPTPQTDNNQEAEENPDNE
jgi:hypothetical protein